MTDEADFYLEAEALDSRETISVAIGILMERQQISRDGAFDVLRRASQRLDTKVRYVAATIAGAGPDVTPAAVDELIESLRGQPE